MPDYIYESLVDVLEYRAHQQADVIAYRFLSDEKSQPDTITYSLLAKQAQAIAAELQQHGMLPGDRALLVYSPGLPFITAYFGCLYAGVIAIPVYPPFNTHLVEKLQHILHDAEASLLLTTTDIVKKFHQIKLLKKFLYIPFIKQIVKHSRSKRVALTKWDLETVPWLATDTIPLSYADRRQFLQITSNHLAFLQYTSGSTGHPKGVMVSHGNLLHNLTLLRDSLKTYENSSIVGWLPHHHDMGMISAILQAFFVGCPLTFMSPKQFLEHPWKWLKAITDYRATLSGAPNFAFDYCVKKITAEQKRYLDLSSLDGMSSGGEPVQADTLERFYQAFKDQGFRKEAFFPTFGIAEATLYVSSTEFLRGYEVQRVSVDALQQHRLECVNSTYFNAKTLVSCGPPVQEVCIVHPETHRLCSIGEIGEIWIRHTPSVAQGYWNKPEETQLTFQAKIIDDAAQIPYLRTGDLGFLHHRQLYVAGRIKDLIIINGVNYYPQDIEHTVNHCSPLIRSGCSIAFAIEVDGKEQLVVIGEVKQVQNKKNESYKALCQIIIKAISNQHQLAIHAIILLPPKTLSKTTSGKLRRRYAKELFESQQLFPLYQWAASRISTNNLTAKCLSEATQNSLFDKVCAQVRRLVSEVLNIPFEEIHAEEELSIYSLDSINITLLTEKINTYYDLKLSPAILFEHASLKSVARYLIQNYQAAVAVRHSERRLPDTKDILELKITSHSLSKEKWLEGIAIIGMSGIFPGAKDLNEFWENLKMGKDGISKIPKDRWNAQETKVKWGGFIDGVDQFDAAFFNISPKEAELMDPQQRLFLETVWRTVEDAGYTSHELAKTTTGLFVGVSTNDYAELLQKANEISAHSATGLAHSVLANRVSYLLNWKGPSEIVDTACSSSLVAIHNAIKSIQVGDCTVAIAGGVNVILTPSIYHKFTEAGMLSEDGRCKTFDERADGYVRGEGVGAILLKPFSKAIEDNDHIYGVIKGSAVNHGGYVSSLTVPNPNAQAELLIRAYQRAHIDPNTVTYIETHGTGTSLGDPIEINGLKKAFAELNKEKESKVNYCGLGTVKTHVGHLEAAAGIVGVIKVLLSMQNKILPGNLHFEKLNPYIEIENSPFYLTTETKAWKHLKNEREELIPYRAGMSSFGFGGANAHIVIEEVPIREHSQPQKKPCYLIMLSAKTENSLKQKIADLESWLTKQKKGVTLEAISYTLNVGRSHFEKRVAMVASSIDEFKETLQQVKAEQASANYFIRRDKDKPTTQAIFKEFFKQLMCDITEMTRLSPEEYRDKLLALANFYTEGYDLDWKSLHLSESQIKISLPTYPFSKKRYWISENPPKKVEKSNIYYYEPRWKATTFNKTKKVLDEGSILVASNEEASPLIVTLSAELKREVLSFSLEELKSFDQPLPRYVIFNLKEKDETNFYSIFSFVQTLLNRKPKQVIDCICCYTAGSSFAEGLTGFWKTVSQEQSLVHGKMLGVELETFNNSQKLTKILIAALKSDEKEICYQDDQYWIKHYQEINLPTENSTSSLFKQKGVYLITGGAGGLGLIFANYLAQNYQAKLILIGRSELSNKQQATISELGKRGAEVLYCRADVAQHKELHNVLQKTKKRFGTLNGIIHSAGVIKDSFILKKTKEEIDQVLAPKVFGTLRIDQITQDEPLDFFILFSSIASIFGNVGQADYAYANGFMDAFAKEREALRQQSKRQGKTLSINWPLWADGGMQIDQALIELMEANLGIALLPTDKGISALEKLLVSTVSQSLVIKGNLEKIEKQLNLIHVHRTLNKAENHPTTTLSLSELTQGHIRILLKEILKLENDETISNNESFLSMGMDSLMLLQLKNKLELNFGSQISINTGDFFDYPTINALVTYLSKKYNISTIATCNQTEEKKAINITPLVSRVNVKRPIEFSLFYFSSKNEAFSESDNYRLLKEGAIFADQNDFTAVWTPERHFHAFGGLFPNPSLTSAYIAAITKRVRIRAGSVILPLHHPVRITEDFAVVDQLSNGRIDIAFGQGWNPNDFIFFPENYPQKLDLLYSGIESIRKLWRGESAVFLNGNHVAINIKTFPRPLQKDLNIWLTCAGGIERFTQAGEKGFNILTHLQFQDIAALGEKIKAYRGALQKNGIDPYSRKVTVMLHTFIGEDLTEVKKIVKEPFIEYLRSSVNLWSTQFEFLSKITKSNSETDFFNAAFERYFNRSALIGTVDTARQMVEDLHAVGVDEIACLIDFGVDVSVITHHFQYLSQLRDLFSSLNKHDITQTYDARAKMKYPASYAQEGLWFLEKLTPGNLSYNEVDSIRIKSKEISIDINRIQQAFEIIAQRHTLLKSVFSEVNGEVLQIVDEQLKLDIRLLDFTEKKEADALYEAKKLALAITHTSFDLTKGPLWKVVIGQLSKNDFILFYVRHHIISDWWSMKVLAYELSQFINAWSTGTEPCHSLLPMQYGEFAVKEREWFKTEAAEKQMMYWQKQLAGIPASLNLSLDYVRPPVQTFKGMSEQFSLPDELFVRLKHLSQEQDVTLFMLLVTVFYILLYRYTEQENIVIGVPVARRNLQEVQQLIGFFVNTLALHTKIVSTESFEQLLMRVKKCALEAYAHQDLPFPKVVGIVSAERHLSLTPLFQVMFQLNEEVLLPLDSFAVEQVSIDTEISHFDLTLVFEKKQESLSGKVVYNPHLFKKETITRLIGHLIHLLHGVIANSKQEIVKLSLLTEEEQQKILSWNNTLVSYPENKTIHQLFEAQVKKTPNNIAAIFEEKQLTYCELNEKANQLAHYLRQLGVKPDTLVAIRLERSLDLIVGMLGIFKAGGAYVPLDPNYPETRLQFMIEDSQAQIILTQEWMKEHSEKIAQESSSNPVNINQPTDLMYVIYTSGTTGKPKGVLGIHRGMVNRLWWGWKTFPYAKEEKSCQRVSLSFVDHIAEIFSPLLQNIPLILLSRQAMRGDAIQLINEIHVNKITRLTLAPSLLKALLEQDSDILKKLQSLRYVFSLAEELLSKVAAEAAKVIPHCKLVNIYGSSEVSADATYYDIFVEKATEKITDQAPIISIGRPLFNVQVYILDAYQRLVPIGVVGELYIGGVGLARGYLNRDDLTKERFIENPFASNEDKARGWTRLYRTGDLCRYLPDGNIEYRGRMDDQVKIRGFRIELGEIESTLREEKTLQDLAIVAKEREENKYLVVYIVLREGLPSDEKAAVESERLRKALDKRLPDYMVPSYFVFLDKLPLTPNGKLDKKALPKPDQIYRGENQFTAPRILLEKKIAEAWRNILGIGTVSIYDNFFRIGGNSILGMKLIAHLRKSGMNFNVSQLFQAKTIAGLATIATDTKQEVMLTRLSLQSSSQNDLMEKNDIFLSKWYPLSYNQLYTYWLPHRETSRNSQNFIIHKLMLKGELNIFALEQSIEALIKRHPMLRVSISSYFPKQKINSPQKFSICQKNLYHLNKDEQTKYLLKFEEKLRTQPVRLEKKIKIDAFLFFLSTNNFVMIVRIPHIVIDGASLILMAKELQFSYGVLSKGNQPDWRNSSPYFFDYIEAERANDIFINNIKFWQNYITSESICKFKNSLLAKSISDEDKYTLLISNSQIDQLSNYCKEQEILFSTGVIALFSLAIYAMIEQPSIIVSWYDSGRRNQYLNDVVGSFEKINSVKLSIDKKTSIKDHFLEVNKEILALYPYNEFSAIIGNCELLNKGKWKVDFDVKKIGILSTIFSFLLLGKISQDKKFNNDGYLFLLKNVTRLIKKTIKDKLSGLFSKNKNNTQRDVFITINLDPSFFIDYDITNVYWADVKVETYAQETSTHADFDKNILRITLSKDSNGQVTLHLEGALTYVARTTLANVFCNLINHLDNDSKLIGKHKILEEEC